MKTLIYILAFSLPVISAAQGFSDFLGIISVTPEEKRQALAEDYLKKLRQVPLTENDKAVFLYMGKVSSVAMAGDANEWKAETDYFSRIKGTDLWYLEKTFETDARLDYKLVLDNEFWILDPGNPHTCEGGFGVNSELRMPGWKPSPELDPDSVLQKGVFHNTSLANKRFGFEYNIDIYLPPGYSGNENDYPLIIFHDGSDYLTLGEANQVLDYLISRKLMQPVVAVFIEPYNRQQEYAGSMMKQYASMIVEDLIPYLDYYYRLSDDPSDRCSFGMSNGGNISLWLGIQHPDVFGKIGTQSAVAGPHVQMTFKKEPKKDIRIYLGMGSYDHTYILERMQEFRTLLNNKGYDYMYEEFHEGHSWCSWNSYLGNALKYLFPPLGE